jgi:hypothetical protein
MVDRRGIEPRLKACKAPVLPLSLSAHSFGIPPGTRTPTNGFGDRHAAITPARHIWLRWKDSNLLDKAYETRPSPDSPQLLDWVIHCRIN